MTNNENAPTTGTSPQENEWTLEWGIDQKRYGRVAPQPSREVANMWAREDESIVYRVVTPWKPAILTTGIEETSLASSAYKQGYEAGWHALRLEYDKQRVDPNYPIGLDLAN